MRAHKDQPKHRNQHAQVPKPTDEEIGIRSAANHRGRRDRQQQRQRGGDLPCRPARLGMRIENRESHRNEELAQIGHAGNGRVGQSLGQRQSDRGAVPWVSIGQAGRRRGPGPRAAACPERRAKESPPCAIGRRLSAGCRMRPSDGGRPKPPQGPKIEQQQQRWNRHQHRLGHQTQGEQTDHGEITPERSRMADIFAIGPQGEHEEQPAEHVAPLGHPGDRLDVQGMQGRTMPPPAHWAKALRSFATGPKTASPSSRVQQDVGQVVSGRMQAIELAVEHVGKHRERIPLAQRTIGESPDNSRPREAARDVRLVEDERSSSQCKNPWLQRPAKHDENGQDQKTAHGNDLPGVCAALEAGAGEKAFGSINVPDMMRCTAPPKGSAWSRSFHLDIQPVATSTVRQRQGGWRRI